VYVTKVNSDGSSLLYSTLIGGNDYDYGLGIDIDSEGNAYITGETWSENYPTTSGAYDETDNTAIDIFITKLNSDGSSLTYSTYIGGDAHDYGNAITVDADGDAYIAGESHSDNYPTTSLAYDRTHAGNTDVIVTKINSAGSSILYSTFIGDTLSEYANGIAIDTKGNAYIIGHTNDYNNNYPTTPGAYDRTHNGDDDVFVSKINSDGSDFIYSTYIGGSGDDHGFGIALDPIGNAYITGDTTNSTTNYPTTKGAFDRIHNGHDDVFVTKLHSSGSSLLYSTYLGGNSDDYGTGIAIDSSGHAYITGNTDDYTISIRQPSQHMIKATMAAPMVS